MKTKLGFGFLRLPKNGAEYDWDTVCRMTDIFLRGGGTYFDTAHTYLDGNSERGIQRCLVQRYPRECFQLANKLPGYLCKSREDSQRYFEESLTRCGVDYFDVYLIHGINGENYEIAEKFDQFRFLQKLKSEGKAKRIGFSYHDNAALLNKILTSHPEVDLVQLQINYLDWDTIGIESGKCYETCMRHGKTVVVMEPVKGGTLAVLPEDAEAYLRQLHPDWSAADWALRFAQSLPGVEICLSGMNTTTQIVENLKPFTPLTADEIAHLMHVRSLIDKQTAIACTACRYCVSHCAKHIPIPDVLQMFNEVSRHPEDDWKIQCSYLQLTKHTGKASDCVSCHSCERHCPQHLPIADALKSVLQNLEGDL